MPNAYIRALSKPVLQSEAADPRQVKNNAGGFTFVVNDKVRLERFLILGTVGGTYYQDETKLTKENFEFLRQLIENDEQLVHDTVREVAESNRALRNSQCILAVAALFTYGKMAPKPRELMRTVCRTATHLFEFAEYIKMLGGWGPAKRAAVAEWYMVKRSADLAYQGVKYRQRNGWTHRDMLRKGHPNPEVTNRNVMKFLLGEDDRLAAATWDDNDEPIIRGFKFAQEAETVSELLNMALRDYPNLPWEAIPTQFLKEPQVWKQLFYNNALNGQALVRNITRLARIGAFNDMVFAGDYAARLRDEEMIKRTRLHPLNYLQALVVHEQGQLDRDRHITYSAHRNKDWATNPVIRDALNDGFYKAFRYLEPTRKRTFLALDVSGSMSSGMCGLDMSAATVAAAMAMVTAKVEPYYQIFGFSDGLPSTGPKYVTSSSYNRSVLSDLGISPSMSLIDVMKRTADQNFGRTDCALPMVYTLNNGIEVDTFVIYTDNETWFGNVHPHVALKNYRQRMGIDAKLVVVACTPTKFSIADPSDRGMLDVVGADSNLPKLIAEFSLGRI